MGPSNRAACRAAICAIALGLPGVHAEAQPAAAEWPRPGASFAAPRAPDPTLLEARSTLLGHAESELARGQTVAATDAFDRAASMLHAPDTEMGLVRAYMQAGQYRRALAFGAHTAGAHRESAPAGALYAWLLRVGGQAAIAERVLSDTLERAPRDGIALEVRRAFAAHLPVATGAMLQTPHRMAPQAVMQQGQPPIPDAARVVASGVLINGGTLALVPNSAVRAAPSGIFWVRNGLGQTTEARIDGWAQALQDMGVTVLRLAAPLDAVDAQAVAPRDPFAGSAGFALQYNAESDAAVPAWPWLHQGFFGSSQGNAGLRRLGIEVAAGRHGGPVLDASGRLAGIALQGPDREALMLPASVWQRLLEAGPAASARPSGAIPADEAYEGGLRLALQVIALR